MVCASADVGALRVSEGSGARVDSSGWPACEECGRRLSRCKGKLYQHGPGKICQRCYNIKVGHQAASVTVPPPPPSRSHKRQASSSAIAASPLPPFALSPPEQPPLHLQPTFPMHGWALQHGHRNSRAVAASWMKLATSTELKNWEEKRGGFFQHSTHDSLVCSHLDELRVRVRKSSEAPGRPVPRPTRSQSLCSSHCDTRRRMRSLPISMTPSSEADSSSYHAIFQSLFGTQKQNMPSNAPEELNCELAHSALEAAQLYAPLRSHHFCLPLKSSNSTTKYDLSLKPT